MATDSSLNEDTSQQLLNDLGRLAQQAGRSLRLRAWLWWTATVLLITGCLMLVDCTLQREEYGIRWLLWLTLVSGVGYAAYRWLRPVLFLRIGPLDVAQWYESQHPRWAGRVTTALELSSAPAEDHRLGSLELRQAILQSWQAEPELPKWRELLDWSALRGAAISASTVSLLLLAGFVWRPDLGFPALKRLFVPWSSESWPRADQLQFVDLPSAVGYDTSLQVEIVDLRPPLPNDVTVQVRQLTTASSISDTSSSSADQAVSLSQANTLTKATKQGQASTFWIPSKIVGELAVASLPPNSQDFQIRAVGGDDRQMDWHTIRVVSVPGWKQYGFKIQPPEYIRTAVEALDQLTKTYDVQTATYDLIGQRIQVLEGSLVQFQGELDTAVNRILLKSDIASSADQASSQREGPWRVTLQPDAVQVTLGGSSSSYARIDQTVAWSFRVETREGVQLDVPGKWMIEALPDLPPEVSMASNQLPSLAIGSPLQFSGLVRDDWGLSDIVLKAKLEQSEDSQIEMPIPLRTAAVRQQSIQDSWDIVTAFSQRQIQLKPDDRLVVWIEARDIRGQVGSSQLERLAIETPQRQLDKITARQSDLNKQLGELERLQRTAQQQTTALGQSLQQNSQASPTTQDLDTATAITRIQQSIRQQLVESPESILQSIDDQLQLLQENGLSSTDLATSLKDLRSAVERLGGGSATQAQQASSRLQAEIQSRLSQQSDTQWSDLVNALDRTQLETADQLKELVQRIDSLDVANRHREQILQVVERQEELAIATNQLNLRSLQSPSEDISQQSAGLAAQQAALASDLEQWLAEMLRIAREDATPASLGQLQNVAEQLLNAQTAAGMRASSNSLQEQQLGRSLQAQNQIRQELSRALDQLRDSSQTDRNFTEQDLAQQKLLGWLDLAGELIEQQRPLMPLYSQLAGHVKLEQLPSDHELLSRDLIAKQTALRNRLRQSMGDTSQVETVRWVFQRVDKDWTRAIAAAGRKLWDPDAMQAAEAGLVKLNLLVAAINQSQSQPSQDPKESNQSPNEQRQPQQEDSSSLPPIVRLKLIQSLQLELQQQTESLQKSPQPNARGQLEYLTAQQAELAELLDALIESFSSPQP